MTKRERKILPFVNKFGDVINPGESVYIVTTCTHRTRVNKGLYIGFVEREQYDWKTDQYSPKPFVQVKVPGSRTVYYDKKTNKKWDWSLYKKLGSDYYKENVEVRAEPYDHISTLFYNRILPTNTTPDRLIEVL